jgi:hypothetical protein
MRSQHCENTMKKAHHKQSKCTSIAHCCVKVQKRIYEAQHQTGHGKSNRAQCSVGEARGHARKPVPALVLDAFQAVLLPVKHKATYMPEASDHGEQMRR